jgi:hypothetical protein
MLLVLRKPLPFHSVLWIKPIMSPKVVSAAAQMLQISNARSGQAIRRRHRPIESLKAGISTQREPVQKNSGLSSSDLQLVLEVKEVEKGCITVSSLPHVIFIF